MAIMAHVCNSKCRPRPVNPDSKRSSTQKPPPIETMSSWLERQASSHQVQLAAVAIASGVVVAGAIYGSQAIRREKKVTKLKASIPEINDSHHADLVRPGLP